jgi:hypothetical protein
MPQHACVLGVNAGVCPDVETRIPADINPGKRPCFISGLTERASCSPANGRTPIR